MAPIMGLIRRATNHWLNSNNDLSALDSALSKHAIGLDFVHSPKCEE
jgi:hypothetical protein